jgi:hypothetical protein
MRILIILLLALFFISEGLAQQQSEKTSGWYVGASSYSELGYFYPSDNLRELPFGFYNDTDTFTGYGFEAGYRHGKSLFGLSLSFGKNTDARFKMTFYYIDEIIDPIPEWDLALKEHF